jgi:hypothetical protein
LLLPRRTLVTATEADRAYPESENAPAHGAFTCLLTRPEPDSQTLWEESRSQVDLNSGVLILDDSTLEKPYSKRNDLVYSHWSGQQKEVVSGINLITLLWTDGDRAVPVDYRVFDKDRDRKTKNDHFSQMLLEARDRGFNPQQFCLIERGQMRRRPWRGSYRFVSARIFAHWKSLLSNRNQLV